MARTDVLALVGEDHRRVLERIEAEQREPHHLQMMPGKSTLVAVIEHLMVVLQERVEEPGDGVVFILVKDEKVLMEHRADLAVWQGSEWLFPGGRRNLGESADAALVREMEEELGVKAIEPRRLPVVDTRHHDQPFLMQPYLVRAWTGEVPPHVLDHPEATLRWVSLGEATRSQSGAVRAMLAHAVVPEDP